MPLTEKQRTNRRSQHKSETARSLRTNATECERKLWAHLRGKRVGHVRFRRQHPIGPYIADFFCPVAKLIVELDGDQHSHAAGRAYDAARTRWLEAQGYRVLRFTNMEVLENREAVLEGIWRAIRDCGRPLPEPPSAVRPSLKGRVE